MPAAAHHRRVELQLNELARRHFGRFPGVYHVDLRHLAALGGGDMAAGEAVLHKMFKMAGPRAVHADALRELGSGSVTAGRKVIERFLERLHDCQWRRSGTKVLQQMVETDPVAFAKIVANILPREIGSTLNMNVSLFSEITDLILALSLPSRADLAFGRSGLLTGANS
jgi:hypothetical protein